MSPLLRYLSDETIQAGGGSISMEASESYTSGYVVLGKWMRHGKIKKDTQRVPGCENI